MFAVIIETAIAMVLLSRVLPYGVSRWANMVVALLQTAAVAFSLTGAPHAVLCPLRRRRNRLYGVYCLARLDVAPLMTIGRSSRCGG